MGAWGYGLFESDHDLDELSYIDEDLALNDLKPAWAERLAAEKANAAKNAAQATNFKPVFGPKTLAEAKAEVEAEKDVYISLSHVEFPDLMRTHLDSGILSETLKRYLAEEKYVWAVLLTAKGMELGCKIDNRHIKWMRKWYHRGICMPGAYQQMRHALKDYNNGEPHDLGSRNIIEAANASEDRDDGGRGFVMLNVRQPGFFGPMVGTQDFNGQFSLKECPWLAK